MELERRSGDVRDPVSGKIVLDLTDKDKLLKDAVEEAKTKGETLTVLKNDHKPLYEQQFPGGPPGLLIRTKQNDSISPLRNVQNMQ